MTQATSHTFDSPRRRSGLLRDQVKIAKRNGSGRYEIARIQDHLSFEKGLYIFIRACQLLAQQNDGIIFVGLAGPSGAGKTKFAEKVLEVMPSIAIIAMDNYNDASRIIDGNFDDPRLTDYETLLGNIHGLKEGSSVQAPIYDFKSSSRIGYRTIEVPSSRIVIIEGIYALSDKLRPFLDLRVSVTGGVHFDLVKRVLRDIQRAGQEPEEIINQISETVYPMYKAFIEPDLQTAHVKIVNKFNPFTGFQNPTYILKSSKAIAEDKIKAVLSMDHEERIEETYDIYLLPPGEDPDTCQSYLRMRNRDGKYNLMFEEWVTDSPFIISPRITFEVSVRLLGGLMALGYTIATILKRSSHCFSNDSICVKTDWLEQINRKYVQVQGRDRVYVKCIAEQLGLDGSYVSRTYIEQIQLEKLVNDVMELPTDLKTKLSIDDDMLSSPKEALSRASADQRSRYLSRGSMTHSYSTQHKKSFSKLTKLVVDTNFDGSSLESPTSLPTQGVIAQVFEQISTLNVRMDDFASQLEMLNSEISARDAFPGQQNVALQIEASNGLASASLLMNGLGNGGLNGPLVHDSSSSSQLSRESSLMEEIFVIGRGQRQIMHQVDTLSNFFRAINGEKSRQERIYVRERNRDVESIISIPVVLTLAIGGLGIFLYRNLVSPR